MSAQTTAFFFALLMMLMVVLPYFVEKWTGKNPFKFLTGSDTGSWFQGLLGRKTPPSSGSGKGTKGKNQTVLGDSLGILFRNRKGNTSRTNASGEGETSPEAENPDGSGHSGASGRTGSEASGQAGNVKKGNGSRNDLMRMISRLLNYARKHRFQILIPGTVEVDGERASLTVILVTRSRIIGVNCYGFGGTLQIAAGENDWVQKLNGQKQTIESPIRKNQQKYSVLKKVQAAAGLEDIPSEVIGIFTTPGVELKGGTGSRCYTREAAMDYLESPHITADGGVKPKEAAKKLEPFMVRG